MTGPRSPIRSAIARAISGLWSCARRRGTAPRERVTGSAFGPHLASLASASAPVSPPRVSPPTASTASDADSSYGWRSA